MERANRRPEESSTDHSDRMIAFERRWALTAPGGPAAIVLLALAFLGASITILSAIPVDSEDASVVAFLRTARIVATVFALLAVATSLWLDVRGLACSSKPDVARTYSRRALVLTVVAFVIAAAAVFASDNSGARRGTAFLVVIVGASALRGVFVALTRGGAVARTVVAESLVTLATLPWVVDLFGDTPA